MIKPPYHYFGGKRAVADLVWERFGNVDTYREPFFGGGAVLLSRPQWHFSDDTRKRNEAVNDIHHFIPNFWRAVQRDPDQVAHYADWPRSEVDLHARHAWLMLSEQSKELVERMKVDPDAYCAKSAGWWVWGAACWIGGRWCDGSLSQRMPTISDRGTNTSSGENLKRWMRSLSERTRNVMVCYGNWDRICDSPTTLQVNGKNIGVFLDPPYPEKQESGKNRAKVYASDANCTIKVRDDVLAWCKKWAPQGIKIAVCGYEGDGYEALGWEETKWKAHGGYGNARKTTKNDNANRERIWWSPACSKQKQRSLSDIIQGIGTESYNLLCQN